jgi:hypothetical protein
MPTYTHGFFGSRFGFADETLRSFNTPLLSNSAQPLKGSLLLMCPFSPCATMTIWNK